MYTWIDDIIWGLCESYGTNDVYEIYDILGICINQLDPNNILLCNNDSLYIRDYFNREIVFIRNDLDLLSAKFILFHELAHAILHTELCEAAFNRNYINKDKLERQANYFALKMLNIEFDEIEFDGMTLEQISKYIGVPYEPLLQFISL